MYKRFDLSASSPWRCLRCGLVFYEEWVASLHKVISNHQSSVVGPD
ncbi:MAG: hypothetical protein WA395_11450 [Nitrososphaeraceae archaeon]|jgi:hypothetical protein